MAEFIQLDIFRDGERTDEGTLARTYRQLTPISNPYTGIGTERDPGSHFEIAYNVPLASEERNNLFLGSRIARNIVCIYAEEASWYNVSFGSSRYANYGLDAQSVRQYFDQMTTGSLEFKTRIASIEARLHGESILLLGINDGRRFNQPVDEENIEAIEWAEVFTFDEVKQDEKDPDLLILKIRGEELPDSVSTQGNETTYAGEKVLRVHKSRTVKFIGDYLPPSIHRRTGKHESALQAAFNGLATALQGLATSNAMLADYSLFWYKLDGLANLVRAKKQDYLIDRFLTLQMSKSVLRGVAIDAKNEEIGFASRSYAGVKDILDTMIDFMVAETGMVRFKVLGTANRAGLGAEGRGLQDRLDHSLRIKRWQNFTWRDPLAYINRLGLLAKNSPTRGKIPKNMTLVFPPVFELDPAEIADLMAKNVGWAKTAIDAQLIEPLEARISLFGSAETILNPTILLDDRVTERMDEVLENKLNSPIPDPNLVPRPKDDPNNNRDPVPDDDNDGTNNLNNDRKDAKENGITKLTRIKEEKVNAALKTLAEITEDEIRETLKNI